MTNVEALKALYTALGGEAAEVENASTIVEVLNAIAAKYEGEDDATANAEAIANIAAVADNIGGGGNAEFIATPAAFKPSTNLANIEIPEGVTSIATSAFANFIALQNVIIPEGTKSIALTAFESCIALKTVSIPSTMETINGSAFNYCSALETITINKPEGSITGAPWGAPKTTQIIWNG